MTIYYLVGHTDEQGVIRAWGMASDLTTAYRVADEHLEEYIGSHATAVPREELHIEVHKLDEKGGSLVRFTPTFPAESDEELILIDKEEK